MNGMLYNAFVVKAAALRDCIVPQDRGFFRRLEECECLL